MAYHAVRESLAMLVPVTTLALGHYGLPVPFDRIVPVEFCMALGTCETVL